MNFGDFQHEKWGDQQTCKQGDWLINNDGDIYTVDNEYFRDHYQRIGPGLYKKVAGVWAEVAEKDGRLETLEGSTGYHAGDYLVFDRETAGKGYAIKKPKFERMYEEVDPVLELTPEQQSYIDQRIKLKINEFKRKAERNQWHYYIWQSLAIITAASVPILSAFITTEETTIPLKWAIALFGGTSAVIAGLLSLFKCQENWIRYRNAYQDLDSNLSQFSISIGIYSDRNNAFDLLAENCENILKAEIGQRAESRSPNKKGEDTGS
ncbi:MAG: DUF4231 domain-containing protein [Mariprofundaceae bacterium]|nr:DUF4231 domain-containing protein [Mariprofundaceae bacterium]